MRTWTAAKFELQINLPGTAASQSHACYGSSLQFDVNTPAERKEPLPRESLCVLLDELAAMASAIAVQGDVA